MRKLMGFRCVLYILCVPDIAVLDFGMFVQYMTFGMYYT